MDCVRVEELLSEYVDDTLDPSTRKQLDKHLARCEECSTELQEMKKYLQAMSSLDEIKAPADFLNKVHERIEQRSVWSRLFEKIFIPLRIKVPLEIAGVLLATLLVVFTYHHEPAENEAPLATRSREVPRPGASRQITEFVQQNSLEESKNLPSTPHAGKDERREAIKLSLVLRQDLQDYAEKSGVVRPLTAPAPEQEMANARSSSVKKMQREKIGTIAAARRSETISIIRDLTQKADGKVLSIHNRPGEDEFVLITVQVPATQYPSFLAGVRQLGELELPPHSSPPAVGSGLVLLRIGLTVQQ